MYVHNVVHARYKPGRGLPRMQLHCLLAGWQRDQRLEMIGSRRIRREQHVREEVVLFTAEIFTE